MHVCSMILLLLVFFKFELSINLIIIKFFTYRLELKCRKCLTKDGNVILRKNDIYCK